MKWSKCLNVSPSICCMDTHKFFMLVSILSCRARSSDRNTEERAASTHLWAANVCFFTTKIISAKSPVSRIVLIRSKGGDSTISSSSVWSSAEGSEGFVYITWGCCGHRRCIDFARVFLEPSKLTHKKNLCTKQSSL